MSTPSGSPAADGHAAAPVPVRNIANLLTVSRLVMVPVFLVVLFIGGGELAGWRAAATAVFLLAAITDHVDGRLARSRGLVTDFGKIADPIADKALMGAALIGLSTLGQLWWWATGIIVLRELGVTLLRFWVISEGVIAASRGGKVKTFVQSLAVVLYLLPLPGAPGGPADIARWVVLGIALVLTVATGVDYVFRALRLRARRGHTEDTTGGHGSGTGGRDDSRGTA